jgi:cysteine desulfurase
MPRDLGVDALSATAHKFYGPHGAGFLWLRAGVSLTAIQYGGFHENERRPGTENVAAIVGMAVAAEIAFQEVALGLESQRQMALRERLWQGIVARHPSAIRNAEGTPTLFNTLNISFPGCDGETLLIGLDLEGVSASSGSACMVGSIQASHVLLAMGVSAAAAHAAVRFSLGRHTTEREIDESVEALQRVLCRQRSQQTQL